MQNNSGCLSSSRRHERKAFHQQKVLVTTVAYRCQAVLPQGAATPLRFHSLTSLHAIAARDVCGTLVEKGVNFWNPPQEAAFWVLDCPRSTSDCKHRNGHEHRLVHVSPAPWFFLALRRGGGLCDTVPRRTPNRTTTSLEPTHSNFNVSAPATVERLTIRTRAVGA